LLVLALTALALPGHARAASSPPIARSVAPLAASPLGRGPLEHRTLAGAERATTSDADDVTTADQTHVILFVPKGEPAETIDTDGTLTRSINALRAWFGRETSRFPTLQALAPRMDVTPDGGYDISFVRGEQTEEAYTGMGVIVDELRSTFHADNKRYLIYAAVSVDSPTGGGVCGEGYYPMPGFGVMQYAVVYLNATAGCGARDFADAGGANGGRRSETIAAHEWLHNEGVAPLTATKHCATSPYHVCTASLWVVPPEAGLGYIDPEAVDVVFPIIAGPLSSRSLDRDRDDYLDHPYPWTDLRDSPWLEPY
jgi:hypothetical protein